MPFVYGQWETALEGVFEILNLKPLTETPWESSAWDFDASNEPPIVSLIMLSLGALDSKERSFGSRRHLNASIEKRLVEESILKE